MPTPNDTDLLGLMAQDRITGFRGRITAVVRYISGCVQVCLTPTGIGPDGKLPDGHFFDVQRVEVNRDVERVILDNTKTPGFDLPPPDRSRL